MPIKIIAIGKKHDSWLIDGIGRYQKRLNKLFDVNWVLLPHSTQSGLLARQDDSKRIISNLRDDDFMILLDETGQNISSVDLSGLLTSKIESSQKVTIVIGGAFGVDSSVIERANFIWSLSKLVFPHQLVRLILIEQIYRAQEIANNKPYHHI